LKSNADEPNQAIPSTRPAFPNRPEAPPVIKLQELKPAIRQNQVPVQPNAMRQPNWVESWVFNGQTQAKARERLENDAEIRINRLRAAGLDEQLLATARLASRGDIVRYFQKVEEMSDRFEGRQPDRNNIQEFSKALGPLQQNWNRGLIDRESLFICALRNLLSEDQKDGLIGKLDSDSLDRRKLLARHFVKSLEKSVPLTSAQRERFVELVTQKINSEPVHRSHEFMVVVHAALKLIQSDLEGFLDNAQVAAVTKLQAHWRANVTPEEALQKSVVPGTEDWVYAIR
jgi:hypothetical protein